MWRLRGAGVLLLPPLMPPLLLVVVDACAFFRLACTAAPCPADAGRHEWAFCVQRGVLLWLLLLLL